MGVATLGYTCAQSKNVVNSFLIALNCVCHMYTTVSYFKFSFAIVHYFK